MEITCNTLLAHFHYFCKGFPFFSVHKEVPASLDKTSKELILKLRVAIPEAGGVYCLPSLQASPTHILQTNTWASTPRWKATAASHGSPDRYLFRIGNRGPRLWIDTHEYWGRWFRFYLVGVLESRPERLLRSQRIGVRKHRVHVNSRGWLTTMGM
jgi:hypothetical protein